MGKGVAQPSDAAADDSQKLENLSGAPYFLFETQEEEHAGSQTDQNKAGVTEEDVSAQLPAIKEQLLDEYMAPPVINSHSLSPYQSPSVSPMVLPLFPKCSPSPPSHGSPSPYQSPSVSPKLPTSLTPNHSPSIFPSLSPVPSPPSSPLTELFCCIPAAPSGAERESGEEGLLTDRNQDDKEDLTEEESAALQMSAARLEETESSSLSGDVEEAAETSPPSANEQSTVQASSEQT